MKEVYTQPRLEVIRFESEDIIVTSRDILYGTIINGDVSFLGGDDESPR